MLSHVGGISTSNSADVVKNQRQINACQIQETILASKDLSGAAKAVLLAVLKYTGGGRHACTAAAATLGKTAGYSPVYVKSCSSGRRPTPGLSWTGAAASSSHVTERSTWEPVPVVPAIPITPMG